MVILDLIYMGSADLFGTVREQKILNENVSSGFRTFTTPVHDRKVSALYRSTTLVRYQVEHLYSYI